MTTWKQPSRKQWPLMIAHSLFFSSFMRHPCALSIFVDVPREYTYTVKSMIIHICAVVATVCVSRNTWHVPWFVVTNLFDAFHSTYGVKKNRRRKERYGSLDELKLVVGDIDIAGRSLIVADVGAERRHRNGPWDSAGWHSISCFGF